VNCGQAKDCGGVCSNADNGALAVPTIIYPNGTAINPTLVNTSTVPLSWNAVGGVVDRYDVTVRNNATGAVAWSGSTTGTTVTTTALAMGQVYRWSVVSVNTTCGTDISASSIEGYFVTNNPPTVLSLSTQNSESVVVPFDVGNNNHICKTSFRTANSPLSVIFDFILNDNDGGGDIVLAQMRWNGNVYLLTLGAVAGNTVE